MSPVSCSCPVLAEVGDATRLLARVRVAGANSSRLEQCPVALAALDVLFSLPVESGFISVELRHRFVLPCSPASPHGPRRPLEAGQALPPRDALLHLVRTMPGCWVTKRLGKRQLSIANPPCAFAIESCRFPRRRVGL